MAGTIGLTTRTSTDATILTARGGGGGGGGTRSSFNTDLSEQLSSMIEIGELTSILCSPDVRISHSELKNVYR